MAAVTMPSFHPHLVAAIADRLEHGEEIWAVFPSAARPLVATTRRVFLLGPSEIVEHPLGDFATVRRARDTLVVLERRVGPSIGIPVDPSDEHGLQALTVLGLLVATEGARDPRAAPLADDPRAAPLADDPPPAGPRNAATHRRRRRSLGIHLGR